MKTLSNYKSFLLLFITNIIFSQTPFRFRVVDSDSKDIKGVLVYVDEIPGSDKYTEAAGKVNFENLPRDRRVHVHFKKEGYINNTIEVLVSSNPTENYKEVKLNRAEKTLDKIIIYGRIEDLNEKSLNNCQIVISCLGKPRPAQCDTFGNYRIELEKDFFTSAKSFSLEVNSSDCTKFKLSDIPYNGELVIEKNVRLKCSIERNEVSQKTNTNFNSVNLSGKWICQTTESGHNITIVWNPFSDGNASYELYKNGKLITVQNNCKWKYFENSLIEINPNFGGKIMIGKIKWITLNNFELTIIDNGSSIHQGLVRHYVRY